MPIKISTIRSLYFYVIAAIGLLMVAFSVGDLVNLGLKTWVFPNIEPVYTSCDFGGKDSSLIFDGQKPLADPEEQAARCEKEREQGLERQNRGRQTSAIHDFSMILIGLPLFLFHFRVVQKEHKENKE